MCAAAVPSCRSRWVARLLAGVLGTLAGASAAAGELTVAVAANFAGTLDRLAGPFRATSGHVLKTSSGSTGKFHAQIVAGAPFDVFLSADAEIPRRLVASGHAVPGTQFTYAVGRLVLWSPTPGLVDAEGRVLADGRFAHLAIANPKTAPYGAAAVAVLRARGLHERLTPRLVTGESIAQAFQFVATGNVALGFVAQSQVLAHERARGRTGSSWAVPAALHAPLQQDAVLLGPGAANPAARAFLDWLKTPAARALIEQDGYALP